MMRSKAPEQLLNGPCRIATIELNNVVLCLIFNTNYAGPLPSMHIE